MFSGDVFHPEVNPRVGAFFFNSKKCVFYVFFNFCASKKNFNRSVDIKKSIVITTATMIMKIIMIIYNNYTISREPSVKIKFFSRLGIAESGVQIRKVHAM